MKTVLTIKENNKSPRTIAVVDIDKYDFEKKIKFIAAILDITITNIGDYYKLFDTPENHKIIIINDATGTVCLIFNEIAEY